MVQPGRLRVHRGRQDESQGAKAQGQKRRGEIAHLRPPEGSRGLLRPPAELVPVRTVRETLRGRLRDGRRGVRRKQVLRVAQGCRGLYEKAQGTGRAQADGLRAGGSLHGRDAPLRRGRDGRHRRRRRWLQARPGPMAGQFGKHGNVQVLPLGHGEPGTRPAPRRHLRDRWRDGPQPGPEGPLRKGAQAPAMRDPQAAEHRVAPARDVPGRIQPTLQQRHRDDNLRGCKTRAAQGPRMADGHKCKRGKVPGRGRGKAPDRPQAGTPAASPEIADHDQHHRVHLQRTRLCREKREALQGHRDVQALDGGGGASPRTELETARRICGNPQAGRKA